MQMLYKLCTKQRNFCFFLISQAFVENSEKRIDTYSLDLLKSDSESTEKVSKKYWAQSEVHPTAPNPREKQ